MRGDGPKQLKDTGISSATGCPKERLAVGTVSKVRRDFLTLLFCNIVIYCTLVLFDYESDFVREIHSRGLFERVYQF